MGQSCNSADVLWPDRDRPRDVAAEMQGQLGVREESWADQDQDQDQEAANKFVYVLPRLVPDIGGNPRASSPHLASHLTNRGGSNISWSTNSKKKKEGSLQTKSPIIML